MSTVLQPSLSAYDVAGGTLTAGRPAALHNRVGILVKQDMGGRAWEDALTNPEVVTVGNGLLLLTNGRVEVDDITPAATLGQMIYITPAHTLSADALSDEVQTVTVDATGGTFDLTFDGQTASGIAFDVSAADLKTALEALSNIGAGDLTVTGGPGDDGGTTPYTVVFGGSLADTNVAQMSGDGTNLTGGAGTATVATGTAGGAATAVPFGRCVAAAGQRGLRATQIRVDLDLKS